MAFEKHIAEHDRRTRLALEMGGAERVGRVHAAASTISSIQAPFSRSAGSRAAIGARNGTGRLPTPRYAATDASTAARRRSSPTTSR